MSQADVAPVGQSTDVTLSHVYRFGGGSADGDGSMAALLGGKGAGLSEMARIGLPVPPGFIISTEACAEWERAGGTLPAEIVAQVDAALVWLEETTELGLGNPTAPLLVSVRSGAPVSMPGMMETVLNLGLGASTREGFAQLHGNERLAADAWRRFVQMYGEVVLGVEHRGFDDVLADIRSRAGAATDADLNAEQLLAAADRFESIIAGIHGAEAIPADPREQLTAAISAVFASWNGEPARVYRRHYGISDDLGTAVTVQSMVYGNADERSGSGVLFTRDPATGIREPYGEWLLRSQGEDVVNGMRTPSPVLASNEAPDEPGSSLEATLPEVWEQMVGVIETLEQHYRDCQDTEFVIQHGELYMLQTRTAKRTAAAALQMALDMEAEGLITRNEALMRIPAADVGRILVPQFADEDGPAPVASGLAASPGAASGVLCLDASDAQERAAAGDSVILVRPETVARDIAGIMAAAGVLTARGGATSHAAVVARGLGTPAVTGCGVLVIDEAAQVLRIGDLEIAAGDLISIDGATGEVFAADRPVEPGGVDERLSTLLSWADEVRTIDILANADTGEEARLAREFGAEGIGLCRTEHMAFEPHRLPSFVAAILADDEETRGRELARLAPGIESDFVELFTAMDGHPVIIRLLDPPLHEFLPRDRDEVNTIAYDLGRDPDELLRKADELRETNPMLGLRGSRLGVISPVVYSSQARMIARALLTARDNGVHARPEVMIPLIATRAEFDFVRERVAAAIAEVFSEAGIAEADYPHVPIGTMLEVPSACLAAGELAEAIDFASFGTNDLTQLTLGLSRDDSSRFLPTYVEEGLYDADPFVTVDTHAVMPLVEGAIGAMRIEERDSDSRMGIGVCGEHGGDPESVAHFVAAGVCYVSCSPYRVPTARLAAAQAVLAQSRR